MLRIAIIIPVHNSLDYTRRCLNGLLPMTVEAASDGWGFDVVVVDDGSTDGTAGWVRENHPTVHLLMGDGNLWWSGGINKGMQYALHTLDANHILWWNNDIDPAGDYFENLKTIIALGEPDTVYGSKVYRAEDPGVIWAYGGFFHRWWGHSYMLGMGEKDGEKFSKPMEADWLPGMGTLLSREAVLKTGEVNDKDFPQYHGDVDYTIRARQAGCRMVVHPGLRIWNHTEHSGHVITSGQGVNQGQIDTNQNDNTEQDATLLNDNADKKSNTGSNDKNERNGNWGRDSTSAQSRGLSTLRNIRSQHHLRKEWLLYRMYVRNPLAYLVLVKKYVGVVMRELG